MFKEIYAESLELDAKVEELLGAEFRAFEGQKDLAELEREIPELKTKGKAARDSGRHPTSSSEVNHLKSLLYAINEDRKRLRAQNFSLICSQTLSPEKVANHDLAQELSSLVLQLEREREEKNQLEVLLSIASAQLKSKKETERGSLSQKVLPKIEVEVIRMSVESPEIQFKTIVRRENRIHTTNDSLHSIDIISETPPETLIPSPRPSRIPVPSRIPQLTKSKK